MKLLIMQFSWLRQINKVYFRLLLIWDANIEVA